MSLEFKKTKSAGSSKGEPTVRRRSSRTTETETTPRNTRNAFEEDNGELMKQVAEDAAKLFSVPKRQIKELLRQAQSSRDVSLSLEREKSSEVGRQLRSKLPFVEIVGTKLEFISKKDLQGDKIAVCEITKFETPEFGQGTGFKVEHNTLYDPLMGPFDRGGRCKTCDAFGTNCPGHFGKILFYRRNKFNKEVPNPIYSQTMEELLDILNCLCGKCGHLRLPPELAREKGLMNLSKIGRLKQYVLLSKKINFCSEGCAVPHFYKINKEKNIIVQKIGKSEERPLYPSEAYEILEKLTKDEYEALGLDYEPSEKLIMFGILVPPPITRPPRIIGGMVRQDDITVRLQTIGLANIRLREQVPFPERYKKYDDNNPLVLNYFHQESKGLIDAVDALYKDKSSGDTRKKDLADIHKIVSSKHGVFRGLGTGKDVDQVSRSVIGPGIGLRADEVGVPIEFTKRMTPKEKVTDANIHYLQRLLENGKVTAVIDLKGQQINIVPGINTNGENAYKLQVGEDLYRHLANGDLVATNRAPTLHKQSIMAHKVVVVKSYNIELPLQDTIAYNADFDGDEMNLHLPGTEEAKADLYANMRVAMSVLSESRGGPLIALTYNALTALYLLTLPGTRLTKENLYDMCMLFRRPPRLFVPLREDFDDFEEYVEARNESYFYRCQLLGVDPYLGKSIFSLLLPYRINYYQTINPPQKSFHERKKIVKTERVVGEKVELISIEPPLLINEVEEEISTESVKIIEENETEIIRERTVNSLIEFIESKFEIKHGILLSGSISKQFVGTGSKFLGYIYREYGGEFGIDFISDADALANWFIEMRGFTMGLNDVIDVARRRENKKAISKEIVEASLKAQFYGPAVSNPIDERRRQRNIIEALNIVQDAGTALLTNSKSAFPSSSFRQMIDSGSKGKILNVAQAGGVTGLQSEAGGLIQPSLEGRISPFFAKGSTTPASMGFISSSLAEGLSVSEKVSEARSIREDLITMKLSTPTSGYMHRRFTTLMQKLVVNYRQGVSDGIQTGAKLIQPIYGECGFAATELYQIKHPEGDFLSPIDMDQLFRNLGEEEEEEITLTRGKTSFVPEGYRLSDEWKSYDIGYLRRAAEKGAITDPRFVNIETGKIDYPLKL